MTEKTYMSDAEWLTYDMGQFQVWFDKLFVWHTKESRWRYIGWISRVPIKHNA